MLVGVEGMLSSSESSQSRSSISSGRPSASVASPSTEIGVSSVKKSERSAGTENRGSARGVGSAVGVTGAAAVGVRTTKVLMGLVGVAVLETTDSLEGSAVSTVRHVVKAALASSASSASVFSSIVGESILSSQWFSMITSESTSTIVMGGGGGGRLGM